MKDVSELFGVRYPIIQGGMAWIANYHLASAVSNGGGLGLIAAGSADAAFVKGQIEKTRELTDKPFGVNVMLMNPHVDEIMRMLAEEKVAVVTTGAGNPGKYMSMLKDAGIRVCPVVASVALAIRLARGGADAIIAEGTEAGGHIGELTTMALIPQIADAVGIPVVAAGGIADGRGIAAAYMLGAKGVQVGTAFLVAEECQIAQAYKDMILKARDTDTVATGRSTGHPVRVLKNRMSKDVLSLEKQGIDPEEFENRMAGTLRAAVVDGDVVNGSVMSGQIAGMVKREETAAKIIEKMFREANDIYENRHTLFGAGRAI
ncbi:MAG: enoyl-[acyl-carrier-protein] reductase FabK [Clostridiales Family XIII bacterium]|nr:enoyl-[acyl-carrier-protein] reductase FabK [Clostridiales Family XIII bacterium]